MLNGIRIKAEDAQNEFTENVQSYLILEMAKKDSNSPLLQEYCRSTRGAPMEH